MDENLVMVKSFESQQAADMAASALESAGIESMVQADSVGGMRHHIAWTSGGFPRPCRRRRSSPA